MAFDIPNWGFFGHRMINKYAVFTLPQEMLPLYKVNINYLSEHAVDPDKRRYATKYEAIRHYIDIDHWGTYPFDNVPRQYGLAVTRYSDWYLLDNYLDTVLIDKRYEADSISLWVNGELLLRDSHRKFDWFFNKDIMSVFYEDEIKLDAEAIDIFFNVNSFGANYSSLIIQDNFSDYGILPYHLIRMQRQLEYAFKDRDWDKVLRLSADFGHYIGDAHVPLHTTENYNGQLSNQIGIHAFWESRIPELFAVDEYDFFAGKASYINNKEEYYWDIVLKSHSYLDQVLGIERELSETFPSDRQFCFDERLGRTIRIQCEEYSKAYSDAMGGMVEERWVASIKAIGDAWYTAWVDAGQPSLDSKVVEVVQEEIKADPNVKTRSHDN